MADIYIPNTRQVWAGTYGWSYDGGPSKFILHSTESDSYPGCVDVLCRYLDGWANPHLVWDPWSGDMAMCGRADWAGGALKAGNKDGSVVLQVEAVGRAGVEGKRPFYDSPMLGWDAILAWADSWGIPHVFPAGLPKPYPESYGYDNGSRPVDIWNTQSGYYSHSSVPGNDHGDPGLVDLAKLFPTTTPVTTNPEDWSDMASKDEIRQVVKEEIAKALQAGTGEGQTTWAGTSKAILHNTNLLVRGQTTAAAAAKTAEAKK